MANDILKNLLNGVTPTLRMTFFRDGAIDLISYASFLDRVTGAGYKLLMVTHDDAQLQLLSEGEHAEMVRFMASRCLRRVRYIYASRIASTKQTVEFARYCRDYYADALVVLPPTDARRISIRGLIAHYRHVARELPIVIDTAPFGHNEKLGTEIIRTLYAEESNVVGIVDSAGVPWLADICREVSDKWSVITTGSFARNLELKPLGAAGHLSTTALFCPDTGNRFAAAIAAGDTAQAQEIISTIDQPFHAAINSIGDDTNAAIQGALEIEKLAGRWLRLPFNSLDDTQIEQLRERLEKSL